MMSRTVGKAIYESKKSKIYFPDESEWGRPVVMKVLNCEFPTPMDIFQVPNEFEIIEGLEPEGVGNAIQRSKTKTRL